MSTQWHEVFEVSFYRLNQREVDVMAEEIEHKAGPIREGETVAAVRSLAEEVRTGKKGPRFVPKVGHIISAIIRNRFLERHPPAELRQKPLDAKLNALKNALIRAPDHAARWEIICDGIHGNELRTVEECKICPLLEAFTLERWPDFRRPQFKPFAQIVHEAAAAIEQGNREEEMTPF